MDIVIKMSAFDNAGIFFCFTNLSEGEIIWKTQIIKEDELEEIIKNKIKTLTLNKKICYNKYG